MYNSIIGKNIGNLLGNDIAEKVSSYTGNNRLIYYKLARDNEKYEVINAKEFGKQLIKEAKQIRITIEHQNWFNMRIEITDSKNGEFAWNVTRNNIYDSYQIWSNTSDGPMCWHKMNKISIKNDLIREFYDKHLTLLKSELTPVRNSTASKYTKPNTNKKENYGKQIQRMEMDVGFL